jgi:hypothetical protein
MGSYAGSSDWDEIPSTSEVQRFAPTRAAAVPAAVVADGDERLALDGARRRGPLDLILAFDTTGSMRTHLRNVREKIEYLVEGLLKLLEIRIAIVGVGDHGDRDRESGADLALQMNPLSGDFAVIRRAVWDIRNTGGGGDGPEAFECLFRHLNVDPQWRYEVPTVLVLITDSVPHGMGRPRDRRCPFGVDARAELERLLPRLKSFYLVNCGGRPKIVELQKQLLKSENYFLQLDNFRRLTNLVMALCMDEVGELDYFMGLLEQQRGKARRDEVLALLRR